MSQELQDHLDKLGIKHFEADPRSLSRADLVGLFGAASSGRIILRKLVRSVIWHVHQGIEAGQIEKLESNIRGFWYLWLKPVISHVKAGDLPKKADPYKAMTEEFTRLVFQEKLMSYRDFDFTDENFEERRIGLERPHVVVFAEKRGWVRLLRRVHKRLSCTTLALGGSPSSLTSEYTARDISKQIEKVVEQSSPVKLHLIGVVDFDPSGQIIAKAFRGHLEAAGLQVQEMVTLIKPVLYSAEQLEMFKFGLSQKQKSRNERWVEATGGIGGLPFGLEAESLGSRRAQGLVEELVEQFVPLGS